MLGRQGWEPRLGWGLPEAACVQGMSGIALVAVASGPVLVGRQAEVGGALVAQRRLPLDLALPTSALSLPLHRSSEHLAGVLAGGGQCLG